MIKSDWIFYITFSLNVYKFNNLVKILKLKIHNKQTSSLHKQYLLESELIKCNIL